MCNCTSSSCGCTTVRGQRGQRGLQGIPGNPGENAQVLFGDGPPSAPPTVATAAAIYEDTADGGNWWQWDITGAIWVDTGANVSGADGADGFSPYTATTAPTTIAAAGAFMLITVPTGENEWPVPGQVVYVQSAGYYGFLNPVGTTQMALINLRNDTLGIYASNAISGPLVTGSEVGSAGIQGPAGLPMVTSSGAGNPSGTPAGGASGWYVESGAGGTYWYFNAPAGPWTDTGIDVIGPTGPVGPGGANGTTPVITRSTSAPSLGADGDLHFQFENPGLIRTWLKSAGVWGYSSANDVVANRMLGFSTSNPTPNPSFIPQNAGDQWWTYIGTQVTMYMAVDASTWTVALTFATGGGGGGGDTFQTVSDNSAGQLTGTRVWNMQRSIQYVPFSQNTLAVGATVTFNTDYQHHKLTLLHDNAVIAYLDPANDSDEWRYELINGTAGELNFSYSATMWAANEGVTPPYTVPTGESVTLICRWVKGYMVIVYVVQNITTL